MKSNTKSNETVLIEWILMKFSLEIDFNNETYEVFDGLRSRRGRADRTCARSVWADRKPVRRRRVSLRPRRWCTRSTCRTARRPGTDASNWRTWHPRSSDTQIALKLKKKNEN